MRPPVSIVVPFAGTSDEAGRTLDALEQVRLRPEDEVLVVDNTPGGAVGDLSAGPARPVHAPGLGSSYLARNVGAAHAANDWLLFLDADCLPAADLLDRFFERPVPERCGALAGGVRPAPGSSLAERYAASRHLLDQSVCREHPYRPMAVTANLLVRRRAFEQAGGFHEVRSGGDADFCWRIQNLGWELELRTEAAVVHRNRERLGDLARQSARYGASRAWLKRRHPGAALPPRPVRELARAVVGAATWAVAGQRERAAFKVVDGLCTAADTIGYQAGNAPRRQDIATPGAGVLDVVIVTELFPELSQTFVASEARALARTGSRVRVLAAARGTRPEPSLARGLDVRHLEDDGHALKIATTLWLAARHPLGVLRDMRDRRRWRREEPVRPLRQLAPAAHRLACDRPAHLHAHFAAEPALDALRLARLLGLPFSITAHAYDIFQRPANLREKLAAADLVTTGCAYNVEHLRRIAGPRAAERVHEIVMGVDAAAFARSSPYPGGRHVVAVGRLIEKKGFADLIEAAALLHRADAVERVTIVGDGPLRDELAARAASAGVADVVVLAGALSPDGVRATLEQADVLAMPCVVAADGDRDSMPVVVKEALAMEVPVVATDEVGLPEIVREPWGRLVPPRDPAALAAAIGEVLARSPDERRYMGREGRSFVGRACDVDREAARLAELVAAVAGTR